MDKELRFKKLLTEVQVVLQKSESQPFTEDLVSCLTNETTELTALFQINSGEAILLSYCINCYLQDSPIASDGLVNHFGKDIIAISDMGLIIETLSSKKLIFLNGKYNRLKHVYKEITLNPKVLVAMSEGTPLASAYLHSASFHELLLEIEEIFRLGKLTFKTKSGLLTEVQDIMQFNKGLPEVNWLLEQEGLKEDDLLVFLSVCIAQIDGTLNIDMDDILREVFTAYSDRIKQKVAFKTDTSCLFRDGFIIDIGLESGWPGAVKLSNKSLKYLFGDVNTEVQSASTSSVGHFIETNKIENETLHYNAKEKKQLTTLYDALQEDKYKLLKLKMQKNNLNRGFTVLFYGCPGTGKTATVKALAKATNRNIFAVDIPKLNSKWVGESEKNIAKIFKDYKKARNKLPVDPILLFNESDAILSKRFNAGTSVDKMNNAIQNILLQELEDFEGILIATTNLASQLDAAFDRRFLYKIEFKKPEPEVRANILKSAFGDINSAFLEELNRKYALTGGQISNLRKKLLVESMLYQETDFENSLLQLCEEECVLSGPRRASIGFLQ